MFNQIPSRKRRKDAGTTRKTTPDVVISIRLSPEIPQENAAIEYFNHYRDQKDERGVEYSARQIITWALHALAEVPLPEASATGGGVSDTGQLTESFWDLYERMHEVVERLQDLGIDKVQKSSKSRKRLDDDTSAYVRNMLGSVTEPD